MPPILVFATCDTKGEQLAPPPHLTRGHWAGCSDPRRRQRGSGTGSNSIVAAAAGSAAAGAGSSPTTSTLRVPSGTMAEGSAGGTAGCATSAGVGSRCAGGTGVGWPGALGRNAAGPVNRGDGAVAAGRGVGRGAGTVGSSAAVWRTPDDAATGPAGARTTAADPAGASAIAAGGAATPASLLAGVIKLWGQAGGRHIKVAARHGERLEHGFTGA